MFRFKIDFNTDQDFPLDYQGRFLQHVVKMQKDAEGEGDAKQESSVGRNQSEDQRTPLEATAPYVLIKTIGTLDSTSEFLTFQPSMAGQDLLELKQLRQVHPGGFLGSFIDGHQIIEGVQE